MRAIWWRGRVNLVSLESRSRGSGRSARNSNYAHSSLQVPCRRREMVLPRFLFSGRMLVLQYQSCPHHIPSPF